MSGHEKGVLYYKKGSSIMKDNAFCELFVYVLMKDL